MKRGDVVGGYEVVTEPSNSGGGMSQWAFARKDGADFFLKLFLAPKFPLDDGPGSPAAKARKREKALAFERRHLEIARRLDPSTPGGGNLVVARAFFRVEATYAKVMDKIQAVPMPPAGTMTPKQIIVVLRSLAFSLRMLHSQDVVHGDIKPDNIMLEASGDLLVSKLIDFDEAYVVGEPPSPELIVGDPSYYSPELLRYIKQDERLPGDALTTASDMFSLGLFLHQFLTGAPAEFDRTKVNYPAEALLARLPIDISAAPPAMQPLMARMVALVPSRRPSIQEVIDFLAEVDPEALVVAPRPPRAPRPVPTSRPAPSVPPRPTTPRPSTPPFAPTSPMAAPPAPGPIRPSAPRPSPTPTPAAPAGLRSSMGRRRSSDPSAS